MKATESRAAVHVIFDFDTQQGGHNIERWRNPMPCLSIEISLVLLPCDPCRVLQDLAELKAMRCEISS